VTAQRLEERLKAAVDSAPKESAVDLDFADPGGSLHLTRGWAADEQDLDSLHYHPFSHRF